MFGDYSLADLSSIFVMQGFAGLILFSVYVLMALGLAIIFGQMGVINMAHGEFMILGAYVTYLCSTFFQTYLPSLFGCYFFVAMALAFLASAVVLITRCVDAEEAFSFVDARLMAMIFAMLAVGEALEHTGTVTLVVDFVAPWLRGLPPALPAPPKLRAA